MRVYQCLISLFLRASILQITVPVIHLRFDYAHSNRFDLILRGRRFILARGEATPTSLYII